MESTIISKENIKPSSPTPHEKRIHKLSLIDQTIPPVPIPIVFHYPNLSQNNKPLISISQTTQTLKQSLSSTLTDFYPLAGTFTDNLTIDCNDTGPLFIVSEFDKTLTAFLTNPDLKHDEAHIRHLIPHAADGAHVLMIQSNHYKCGGVVLALLFYHHAADGISMATFTKAWAAKARGLTTSSVGPTFPFHSSFPSNPKMRVEHHLSSVQRRYFRPGKTVVRRYVFDSSAISTLQSRLPLDIIRPTRVELVTALLWKCFMAACATSSSRPLTSLLTHSVDMRRRAEPRLPGSSFGNFFWLAPASAPNDEPSRDVEKLVERVRSAMRKVDSGFIKALMEGEGGYRKNVEETWEDFPEEADYLAVTSWCGLGIYDVDFGWGRPAWITQCSRDRTDDEECPMLNALWLMDTRDGDGVEAWMKVDERYGPSFDESEELRGLSKIGPSPLDVAGIVIDRCGELNNSIMLL